MSDSGAAAWRDAPAPSLDDFAALAQTALAALPEKFQKLAGDVVFRIDDFPSDDILDDLELDDPYELTGLYQGVALTRRSVLDPSPEPARIFLYRRPILDEWAERGDVGLAELVAHVLTHEIGHHFGLSDADIDAIEAAD